MRNITPKLFLVLFMLTLTACGKDEQKNETVDVPEEVSMQVTEKVEEENEREGGTGIAAITNQTSEANDTDKLAKMIASQFSVKSGIVNR